ncbi:hypothetical protein [Blastococcus xanthinilyticus]|uniref:Uncharacterized protein n=1 Tax=Blastococcus xanthinilyticus TaxID=1564164 RepID=A0A5S5CXJ4_9ACTN|nr:hypothetical protein [Blastococcus xanthinilyticus]TYP87556.1 hypothetical protein BD833_106145 [Blastococcus xanthinilyticus]
MSISPDQTYLARNFEDERWAWARPRRVRRRAVLAQVVLLTALIGATVVAASTGPGWTTWYFVALTVSMLGFIPLHSVLNAGIRGVFDRSDRSLDEHQQRLRDRSYVAVAWPSSGLHLSAWAGAVAVVALSGHVVLALYLGFLLWFAAGLLAYWHLAWTAPDEPADADL